MIEVVQAFDRTPISENEGDDAGTLDRIIDTAVQVLADRYSWLKPHED